jgi:hypothetical protein
MTIPKIELRVNTANPTLFYLRAHSDQDRVRGDAAAGFLNRLEDEGATFFARAMSLGRTGHWMIDSHMLPAVIARANAEGVHFTVWTED